MALQSCNTTQAPSAANVNSGLSITPAGYGLLYSDNPELINYTPQGSSTAITATIDNGYVLYFDYLSIGRCYLYAVNNTSNTLTYVLWFVNYNSFEVTLTVKGWGFQAGSGQYSQVSANAWAQWQSNKGTAYSYNIPANSGLAFELTVDAGLLGNMILDFSVVETGTSSIPGNIGIFFGAAQNTSVLNNPPPLSYAPLQYSSESTIPNCVQGPYSYGSSYYGLPVRGKFGASYMRLSWTVNVANGNQLAALFCRAKCDQYGFTPISGETYRGSDNSFSPPISVWVFGNFPFVYSIELTASGAATARCWFNFTADSAGHQHPAVYMTVAESGATSTCEVPASGTGSWNFEVTSIPSGGSVTIPLELSLSGGGSGDMELVVSS